MNRRSLLVDFEGIHRDIERLFEHLTSRPPRPMFGACVWMPSVDVCETSDEVIVLAEMAGADQESIQAEVEGQILTLRGVRRRPSGDQSARYHQMEIRFGAFERQINLPEPVDSEQATASYRDGFLRVVLPKRRRSHRTDIAVEVVE